MVLGAGALAAAVVPALGAWRALTQPAVAAAAISRSDPARGQAEVAPLHLAEVRVTPALRGEVVASVTLEPGVRAGSLPLAYRLRDSAGRALVERTVSVPLPDLATSAAPATITIGLGKFPPPADGRVELDLAVTPGVAAAGQVAAMRVEVRHELEEPTVAAIIAAFMATGGIIAVTVGIAGRIARRHPRMDPVPLAPAARHGALACHLAGFVGYVVPFGNVLAALGAWRVLRERSAYVDEQGREALNFQLTVLVYLLLIAPLVLAFVGLLMLPLLLVFHVVMMVGAARRAAAGSPFHYPACIRFIH